MKGKHKARQRIRTTKHWFKSWSNEYDKTLGRMGFHAELLDLVVALSRVKDGDKVLDIGCGTGLSGLKFLQAANCHVTGIDNSKDMLCFFKKKINDLKLKDRVTCEIMDASHVRFKKNTFDIAASAVTLHHLKDKERPLKRIYECLKPGGVFVLGDIDMDTTGEHADTKRLKHIVKVLEHEWIFALRDAGIGAFRRMYMNGIKHILNEGEYCVSFKEWARLSREAGFKVKAIESVPSCGDFKVLLAKKPYTC